MTSDAAVKALSDAMVGVLTNPPDREHNARYVALRLERRGFAIRPVECDHAGIGQPGCRTCDPRVMAGVS